MCELQESQNSQRGVQWSCRVQAAFSIVVPSIKKLEAGIKHTFSVYHFTCLWRMDYLEVTHT